MAKHKKIAVDNPKPQPATKKEIPENVKKRLEKLSALPLEQQNKIRKKLAIIVAVHKLIEDNKNKN